MKKFLLFLISLSLTFILIIVSNIMFQNKKITMNSSLNNDNKVLSMMIETNASSGIYQESKDSVWPTTDYTFNSSLSKCENGSTLTWDNTTKKVLMKGNNSDKCYVYFDVVPPILLADHIKELYTSQGANGLYLHNSSLANSANDNSYRYAGANPNNYVCFGTDVRPCPTDNLYRIIGVFGDQVKLIKSTIAPNTLLGTDGAYNSGNNYYWNNSTNNNNWNESNLNKINLNTNYINKLGTTWTNKIATTTWKVGGNTWNNVAGATAPNAYKNEIVTPEASTTYNAKIGLMYVSDYGFAADPSAWTTTLSSYNGNSIPSKNWMYMGLYEWTISRRSNDTSYAFHVYNTGYVSNINVRYYLVGYNVAVRPVFYLTPSVTYLSGSGTQNDPILIN